MSGLLNIFNRTAQPAPFTPAQKDDYFTAIKGDKDDVVAAMLAETPSLLSATAAFAVFGKKVELTGIDQAIISNSDNCFQYLLARHEKPLNAPDTGSSNLLALALEWHNNGAILALIDNGAHYVPGDGTTPLMLAFSGNNQDLVPDLLTRGFKMTDRDDKGRTPLFFAIYNGNADNIALARNSGGDIHAVTNNGQTMLMEAARCGNTTAIGWMLDEKLDINARDKDGRTALNYLALETSSFNLIQTAEFLLSKGAYINAEDKDGKTLEDLLRSNGKKPKLLELIARAGHDPKLARVPLNIEMFHEGTTRKLRPLRTTRFKAPAA